MSDPLRSNEDTFSKILYSKQNRTEIFHHSTFYHFPLMNNDSHKSIVILATNRLELRIFEIYMFGCFQCKNLFSNQIRIVLDSIWHALLEYMHVN